MPETAYSILARELCVVAREAGAHGIPVIIGGGMGLLLKDEVIRGEGSFEGGMPTRSRCRKPMKL